MPSTPVQFVAPPGMTLSMELYPYGSDTVANSGGDTAIEQANNKGLYEAIVDEPLTGWYHVRIVASGGATLGQYDVLLADDTAIHRAHSRPQEVNVEAAKLASDGLDAVSMAPPVGVATNFREMIVQLWRRFFKKTTLTATELQTFADDGITPLTTQDVADDGAVQTQEAAT